MTVQRVSFQQNVGNVYTAEEMRRVLKFLANRRSGVNAVGDLAVSQNGTPNMSVNVAAGEALELGSETTTQGVYYAYNDAVLNRTIAASDATNPRNDLVVVRVRDQFYSGTFNDGDVIVVTGTPAPSPVDPTPPANYETLARVRVNANATTITNANITDLRVWQAQKLYPGPNGLHVRNSGDTRDNFYVDDNGFVFTQGAVSIPPSFGGTLPPSSYGSVPVKFDDQQPTGASVTIPASGSIPGSFRKIRIDWKARDTSAGTGGDFLQMQLNGVGVYDFQMQEVYSGTPIYTNLAGQTLARVAVVPAGGASAGLFNSGWIEIIGYADTTGRKHFLAFSFRNDGATLGFVLAGGQWQTSNAAVTSIVLSPGAGSFATGTFFRTELSP